MSQQYMLILLNNDQILHLKRSASFKSWILLYLTITLGVYFSFYAYYWFFKLSLLISAILCGYYIFETYDECLLDRRNNKISLFHDTLFTHLLGGTAKNISILLSEVDTVDIESETKYGRTCYTIRLVLSNGYRAPLTHYGVYMGLEKIQPLANTIEDWISRKELNNTFNAEF